MAQKAVAPHMGHVTWPKGQHSACIASHQASSRLAWQDVDQEKYRSTHPLAGVSSGCSTEVQSKACTTGQRWVSRLPHNDATHPSIHHHPQCNPRHASQAWWVSRLPRYKEKKILRQPKGPCVFLKGPLNSKLARVS
mmetsp:Transcript_25803/g.66460  ORF Transcript_25803/g.66460 Transcript_25803/m.66460 type:complete len:137 (+) Transcript_25803:495-905(+)|eukprot:1160366-Pelagomonas_calceolata.AAC.14